MNSLRRGAMKNWTCGWSGEHIELIALITSNASPDDTQVQAHPARYPAVLYRRGDQEADRLVDCLYSGGFPTGP